ncbi:phosphosulfolactate synthase [Staphylospora marina]|uniref:phosphosulfolactate synthase n=1 Tax=Staphylospora marina TaxID=2490858 RepID=UPI000F5BB8AF|nr:phosphosulfolactate synthase [Staphylospora marina]
MKPVTPIWDEKLADPGGRRRPKPRPFACTMVMDKGLGSRAFLDLTETAGEYVDFIKLGFGTAAVTPPTLLKTKIEQAVRSGINLYPGGTFFETAWFHGKAEEYFEKVKELGMNWVEISDGTIPIAPEERSRLIRKARETGLFVLTEVGKKSKGSSFSVGEFLAEYETDLEDGASYVIVEGRETGTHVGIFDEQGRMDRGKVEAILRTAGAGRIIWEAPRKHQQVLLLELTDGNANLGNIPPEDVLSLECLRRGLRSDTWHLFCQSDPVRK